MAELLESILNQILKAQATEQLEAEYYNFYNLMVPVTKLSYHKMQLWIS